MKNKSLTLFCKPKKPKYVGKWFTIMNLCRKMVSIHEIASMGINNGHAYRKKKQCVLPYKTS